MQSNKRMTRMSIVFVPLVYSNEYIEYGMYQPPETRGGLYWLLVLDMTK